MGGRRAGARLIAADASAGRLKTVIDDRALAARARELTLEQRVRLLTGADFWSLHAEPSIGLRRIVVSDGPAGVRGERWDEREPSANVPSPTALAATWDEELVARVGRLLAFEARRKGVDVLLAPAVNLHRTPYAGRHFECFSEDPLLTSRIGVAYVRGVQSAGVGATVKHFVANDSETERMTLDARIDERTLHELYLAPFEAIVREAGVWSVMAAYNGVNGTRMTESPLLRDVLRRAWGFDGLVMSDWFATRSTAASAAAGLDVVMPGPGGPWGDALVDAVRAGLVDEREIDEKVVRILRLAARVGALEGFTAAPAPVFEDRQVTGLLRRAAAAGFVLAHNDGTLPLDRDAIARVAVIGPNALAARTMGGGSATVFPPHAVSPLEGLRAALPERVAVEHAVGVLATERIPVAGPEWLRQPDGSGPGVEVRFLAAGGTILATERRRGCAFTWLGSFGHGLSTADVARVEVHTVVRATAAGTYAIAGSGVGRYELRVGGELVFDGVLELAPGADLVEGIMAPPQAVAEVDLERGQCVDVVLAHDRGSTRHDVGDVAAAFQLNLLGPHASDGEEIERAVRLAQSADAAIVVVGTTEEVESEGFDRASLSLPGRQDELVERVAAANAATVVVVNAGAPVLMPWADWVAAVLIAWFPGQEFGNALSDVLFGLAEPGGRLPTTWPGTEVGLPSTRPVDGVLAYDEGLSVGYRRGGRAAGLPFGHGLGYTSWEYRSIWAPEALGPAGAEVRVVLRNTGSRRGREVVQLYASRSDGAVARPARWLVGFAAVEADPGADVTAIVSVAARAFAHWDAGARGWSVEPGSFELAAGGSCAVTPVATSIRIVAGEAR